MANLEKTRKYRLTVSFPHAEVKCRGSKARIDRT